MDNIRDESVSCDEQVSGGIQTGTFDNTIQSLDEARKQAKLTLIKTFFEAQLLCNQFNQIYAQQAVARNQPVLLTVISQDLLPEGLLVMPAPISNVVAPAVDGVKDGN